MTDKEYLDAEWTEAEIRTYYRQLKGSSAKKINLLMDLTLKSKSKIETILGLRVSKPSKPKLLPADWTVRVRELHGRGYSDLRISRITGYPVAAVEKFRKQNNLPEHQKNSRISDADKQVFEQMHRQGYLNKEIAAALGITSAAVSKMKKGLNAHVPPESAAIISEV